MQLGNSSGIDLFGSARVNMVLRQIKSSIKLDAALERSLIQLPREAFVLPAYSQLAYSDAALPLPNQQSMWRPRLVASMLMALAIQPGQRVLEIGSGSGYISAVLALLGCRVRSVERLPSVHSHAMQACKRALPQAEAARIQLLLGDGLALLPTLLAEEPIDCVLLTGALPRFPQALFNGLVSGTKVALLCGVAPCMQILVYTKLGKEHWLLRQLGEACAPSLEGTFAANIT
jgi:protein-L-isoaspartate(D-aspartate) O-methyltransferase